MGLLASGKPNVKSLARRGDIDALIDAVFYEDPQPTPTGHGADLGAPVRAEAVRALAEFDRDEAGLAVVDALSDRSDLVRSAAVGVLALWGEALPLANAIAWLPAESSHARRLTMIALERLAQSGTARALARALVHAVDDKPLRETDTQLVTQLLAAEGRPEAVDETIEVLIEALGHERGIVGERAAELLTRLGASSPQPIMAALSKTPSPHALSVLGTIGDPSILEPLTEALEHPDPRMRSASCAALGELRKPAAVEPLLLAANDPDPVVRASAGAALDQIGNVSIIFGIAALLRPIIEEAVGPASRQRRVKTNGRRPEGPHGGDTGPGDESRREAG
jgi:HEAT repeat protein